MSKREITPSDSSAPPKRLRNSFPVPSAPRYEFEPLIAVEDNLRQYAKRTTNGTYKIDFSLREATLALTQAILKHHFKLVLFLPEGQLIPTIPNRVQYLTWAASLLPNDARKTHNTLLDIGTGPSCIYSMLGARLFPNWNIVATDADESAVQCARKNCNANELSNVKVLYTGASTDLLPKEVTEELPSLTVCNPPFHSSYPTCEVPAGTASQLMTEGGEYAFICRLAIESTSCLSVKWFTSLVGRKVDLPRIVSFLRSPRIRALYVKTAELAPGGRTVRWAVAWSFGEECSVVKLISNGMSKWRQIVSVRPGKKYGNQLETQDISDIFHLIFPQFGWVAKETDVLNSSAVTYFQGPVGSDFEESEIHIHVRELTDHEFEVHLKTERRGLMTYTEFQTLCTSIIENASSFLNES